MTTALIEELCAHYERVRPLLEATLGRIPVASASFPNGFDKPPQWHVALHHRLRAEDTVEATTPAGTRTYLALHDRALEWAIHALGSIEFHSWSPRPDDFARLAFAHILLKPAGKTPPQRLREAALAVRTLLRELELDAIALLDGVGGIALWLPFEDGPAYDPVRAWLHQLAARLALAHPRLFVTEPHARGDGLVHIHVAKNAPGTFTGLPYSARGRAHLPVCLPVRWEELDAIENGSATVASLPDRLKTHGDVFALERERIGPQSFSRVMVSLSNQAAPHFAARGHGHVIATALEILSDGKMRSAQQILEEAIARKLLPPEFGRKLVYTSLIEYIVRARGAGRKAMIVQDERRNFRINEPPDDWPALPAAPAPPLDAQGLIDRLAKTATGTDPAAFEIAVCDAFAHLGFASMHVGGLKAPDGYADAQLGPLGYRVMIECKTAKQDVSNPNVFEAAKYRDPYGAQYCTLIGPAFPNEIQLTSELHTHGVSAWTLGDLQTALSIRANPQELRALFEPGYAADALADLVWERHHGEGKRVRVVADLIRSTGWHLQTIAAKQRATWAEPSANGASSTAARLTVDAAMVLVDEALAADGSQRSCTRDEVQLAFEHLTNPIVRDAVWTDATKSTLVILSP